MRTRDHLTRRDEARSSAVIIGWSNQMPVVSRAADGCESGRSADVRDRAHVGRHPSRVFSLTGAHTAQPSGACPRAVRRVSDFRSTRRAAFRVRVARASGELRLFLRGRLARMGSLGARGWWVAVVVLALAGCDGGTAAWMVSLASLGDAEPRPERLRRAHRRGASVCSPRRSSRGSRAGSAWPSTISWARRRSAPEDRRTTASRNLESRYRTARSALARASAFA
jgi:hypothetical protein